MKKKFTLAALSLAVLSATSHAQETQSGPAYENWIGIFGMKYNPDSDKGTEEGIYEDGRGYGAELGVRFNKSWAARIEYTSLKLDYADWNNVEDDSGQLFGADVMYFLPNDAAYMFAGAKRHAMLEKYDLVNVGFGKHWSLGGNFKLITEVAGYHDFGDDFNDFSMKLGIAYTFGQTGSGGTTRPTGDSDNDGVPDNRDQCPMTPAGVSVDANGCNSDEDGDGVANGIDQCPDTPYGTEVNAQGCPLANDSDNDGVNDDEDQCANTPLNDKVDSDGCTVFEEEEVTHTLRVLFDQNSPRVQDPNSQDIQDFANFMKRYGKTTALIEGHTSAPGTEEYNMDLSIRRANAFKAVLIDQHDIHPSRLETKGFGETQLLDESNTAEAHRVNRRISIRVSETVKVPEERED